MIPDYLDIPIFPLPNVTFFPKTVLPLHVFEPRYRALTAACLNGDRMMGVALLKEGWQSDYFGRPAIHRIFGAGKIVDCETAADGRYHIVLEGLYRVRLIEEHAHDPYRVGRVEVLRDDPIDHRRAEVSALMKELEEALEELASAAPGLRGPLRGLWSAHPHPGVKADLLAGALTVDAYERQSILDSACPVRRLRLVLVQARRLRAQAAGLTAAEELREEEG